jgi:hypothetical protein
MADVVYCVDNGLAITVDRLLSAPTHDEPKWLDMGTGATGADPTDTTLETPGPEARTVGVLSAVTTGTSDDTLQCVGTITKTGAPGAITECGQFTHLTSAAGYLYLRATFDAINLGVGDSIEFTTQVQYTN